MCQLRCDCARLPAGGGAAHSVIYGEGYETPPLRRRRATTSAVPPMPRAPTAAMPMPSRSAPVMGSEPGTVVVVVPPPWLPGGVPGVVGGVPGVVGGVLGGGVHWHVGVGVGVGHGVGWPPPGGMITFENEPPSQPALEKPSRPTAMPQTLTGALTGVFTLLPDSRDRPPELPFPEPPLPPMTVLLAAPPLQPELAKPATAAE